MKYLIDSDGKVFKAIVIKQAPQGFTDITDMAQVDADAQELNTDFIEALPVAEVPAIEAVEQHWTNGEDTVYNANDIPTLTDESGDPYLDPAYVRVPAVAAEPAVPAHYRIKKTSSADQELRQIKMDRLSALREPLLAEADIEINKLEDNGGDSSAWRTYRQALRDITEEFKKVNGEWKVLVDNLVVEEFEFPVKP